MAWECFDVKREGGVAHVVLNRPAAMNAMNLAFWRELPQLIRQLEVEGGTRVAVLSSTGKHFTAGMDLSVFSGGEVAGTATAIDREQFRLKLVELQQTFLALANARFPVIAAVHGGCIGGGVDMVSDGCGDHARLFSKQFFKSPKTSSSQYYFFAHTITLICQESCANSPTRATACRPSARSASAG